MPVRSSMSDLITTVRRMIADPSSESEQFTDLEIQDRLDDSRDDIRYEMLAIAPTILNAASTNNVPETIYADYYSTYKWWEADVVLQGQDSNANPWAVLTPTSSDLIVGHWQFEANIFTAGTVPGQIPPLFATGKVYDLNWAAAELLEFWAALYAGAYDVTVDGQTLKRSQLMQAKLTMSQYYRKKAKLRTVSAVRNDVLPSISTRSIRLLDSDDIIRMA